jgi:hypothetical protein
MKKSIVLFVFAIASLTFVSCKEEAKEATTVETKDAHEGHNHEAGEVHATYSCPMDCEKGKTYAEAGKCPVCEMDLVAVTETMEDHEGHNH